MPYCKEYQKNDSIKRFIRSLNDSRVRLEDIKLHKKYLLVNDLGYGAWEDPAPEDQIVVLAIVTVWKTDPIVFAGHGLEYWTGVYGTGKHDMCLKEHHYGKKWIFVEVI